MSFEADHAVTLPSILTMPLTGIFHMPLTGIFVALLGCVDKQWLPLALGSSARDDNRHTLWLKPEGEWNESVTTELISFALTKAVMRTGAATAAFQALRTGLCGPATATGGILQGPETPGDSWIPFETSRPEPQTNLA